jgi:tetraacyldisaccharide 4'-kinase
VTVLAPISALYGRALLVRRRRIESHPSFRSRLQRPVISIGNLSVGGSGKTPFVRWLASWLVLRGHRPAILSRGYRRTSPIDRPVIVSDGDRVLADLAASGDEPMMLARAVRGAAVVVDPDRYRAGTLAETRLGCTVHLLDDGFQHLKLHRDINLLLLDEEDLQDRVLPAGRLREPLAAARSADAVLWTGEGPTHEIAARIGVAEVFQVRRDVGPMRVHSADAADTALALNGMPSSQLGAVPPGTSVVALAAIARPERFFGELERAGLDVRDRLTYRDHHPYTAADVQRIQHTRAQARASLVATTEKDLTRLTALGALPFPVAWQRLDVVPRDIEGFGAWMAERLARVGQPFRAAENEPS